MEEITGIIGDIIFRNEDNGYSVVDVLDETTKETVTVVGSFPFINPGEMVLLTGEWVTHPDYGLQFKMVTYNSLAPSTTVGMENYLASGLINGVGPSTAKKLVEHFGLDVLDIIQFNPLRLTEVVGIGKIRAELIASSFSEQREIREVMIFLQSYSITTSLALKIYKAYGNNTIALVKKNPYRLAEDIDGVGFKTADLIAAKLGVDSSSIYRIMSGARYALHQAASDGHTYLPKDELVEKATKLLSVGQVEVENAIVQMALNKTIAMENNEDQTHIFLSALFEAEARAAVRLLELSLAESDIGFEDIDKQIKDFEGRNDIELAESQKVAVTRVMEHGIVVITGGPGTGKTTTINCIINLLRQKGLTVELTAPTGRAAKRMSEATGFEAKTIHRLLEYGYSDDGWSGFQKNEDDPLKSDAIIIDEMSMVDIMLLNSLLRAIPPGTRLVMVGDVDQLPSVGPGNVLRDIIKSETVTVVQLTEIFRQAQESMIITNAHRINKGDLPILNAKEKDFFFDRRNKAEDIVNVLMDLVNRRLPGFGDYHPIGDIQILVPMRKGIVGVNNLNIQLQRVLNPPAAGKSEKLIRDTLFREQDKVMQIKNNYTLKWSKIEDGQELYEGEGVFNGDMGYIKSIDNEEQTLEVLFDDSRQVEYEFNQLDELELAYAVSIHKSQGSEFPVVIIPLFYGPPMLMTRNLLYTAVTRARELVVLVGRQGLIGKMVDNNHIARRYSGLAEKLNRAFVQPHI
ncbi:MAG TPA: ATP-dependent RecD-like DNA helicase [Bacillota bacterium]|nr:ATP-dependent RecD-like DNA helicase [Bacillota bacterium]